MPNQKSSMQRRQPGQQPAPTRPQAGDSSNGQASSASISARNTNCAAVAQRQTAPVRACVIFNPTAKGDKARKFRENLAKIGATAELKQTTHAGAARDLAKAAVDEGFDTIIAAGGDGTLNEVANGIGDAENGYARARFAALPLGTVNVFALELGIPFALKDSWQVALEGRERVIDLPEATFHVKEKEVRRRFLQLAGAGWDARAVELVSWELKKRIGRFAYIWAGLGALQPRKSKVELRAGGERCSGDFVLLGNGKFYGGRYPFLHKADMTDGLVDVTVFPKFDWGAMPGCAANFVLGRYFRPGLQNYLQAAELEITSEEVTPFQLDGDLVGHLPAKVRVLPKILRVLTP
jgi:diacylglycerol kinase (ATP)